MLKDKYVAITPFPVGMGAIMTHTLAGLLYAELTQRTPVIVWTNWCVYHESKSEYSNTFNKLFQPINSLNPQTIFTDALSYYPESWSPEKLLHQPREEYQPQGTTKGTYIPYDLNFEALQTYDVFVFNHYMEFWDVVQMAPSDHPIHGMGYFDALHWVYKKYLILQDTHIYTLNQFMDQVPADTYLLGVHYRATDKYVEAAIPTIQDFIYAIRENIADKPKARIFIATDSEVALKQFQNAFTDKILFTPSIRASNDEAVHLSAGNALQKGIDILLDAHILSKCQKILVNPDSNVVNLASAMIRSPKDRDTFIQPIIPSWKSKLQRHIRIGPTYYTLHFLRNIKQKVVQLGQK